MCEDLGSVPSTERERPREDPQAKPIASSGLEGRAAVSDTDAQGPWTHSIIGLTSKWEFLGLERWLGS